jgi:hypothetical protein
MDIDRLLLFILIGFRSSRDPTQYVAAVALKALNWIKQAIVYCTEYYITSPPRPLLLPPPPSSPDSDSLHHAKKLQLEKHQAYDFHVLRPLLSLLTWEKTPPEAHLTLLTMIFWCYTKTAIDKHQTDELIRALSQFKSSTKDAILFTKASGILIRLHKQMHPHNYSQAHNPAEPPPVPERTRSPTPIAPFRAPAPQIAPLREKYNVHVLLSAFQYVLNTPMDLTKRPDTVYPPQPEAAQHADVPPEAALLPVAAATLHSTEIWPDSVASPINL